MPPAERDDVGKRIVARLYQRAKVDHEWSVWDDRGYTWWGHHLAQRVWSEPPHEEAGDEVWLLRARSAVLCEVEPTPDLLPKLAALNRLGHLGAFTWEAESRTVSLRCTFPAMRQTEGFAEMIFSWAAAVQADLAHKMGGDNRLNAVIGGHPATSEHPTSGPRTDADDMLSLVAREIAPRGSVSPFGIADFRSFERLPDNPSVLTNLDEDGLTAEFVFGGYTGLFKEVFGPKGRPHTALLTAKRHPPHPSMGAGCWLRLSLPTWHSMDEAADLANRLNLAEHSGRAYLYGVGAWCVDQTADSRVEGVCHTTFLPAMLHGANVFANFASNAAVRTAWCGQDMGLRAPGSE